MSKKNEKELRQLERGANELAAKLDEAIRDEFYGYLLKLRSQAQRLDLREKVATEAKQSLSLIVGQITKEPDVSK